jgi:hypothetical protein
MHDDDRGNLIVVDQAGSVSDPCDPHTLAADPNRTPGLTDLEVRFAQAFVENGGKIGEAALTAGASHETYGHRVLARKKVQDEIARRVKLQAGSALAIAFSGLIRVIESAESDERAVVAAALGLMDRFGMAPPKGPSVAVQVNNVGNPGAQQVSAVLQQIFERRQARLGQAKPE